MKIHWLIKAMTFIASVMTLSGFFAGWRQIHQTPGLMAWATLVSSTLATLALLFLQGFWIYLEEKQKGTLGKKIGIFENLYDGLVARGYIKLKIESCCGVETKKA